MRSKKPQYAIVNDAVEEGKTFKKEKLINAVLRNILRTKIEDARTKKQESKSKTHDSRIKNQEQG